MDFNELMAQFVGGEIYKAALQFVGAAALLAALTPNPSDNQILGLLKDILNLLGANFGYAKNAIPAKKDK